MAVPNYTYLKMKMPGPKGVITIRSSLEHAYECDAYKSGARRGPRRAAARNGQGGHGLQAAARGQLREGTKDVTLDPKTPDGKALKISATLDNK